MSKINIWSMCISVGDFLINPACTDHKSCFQAGLRVWAMNFGIETSQIKESWTWQRGIWHECCLKEAGEECFSSSGLFVEVQIRMQFFICPTGTGLYIQYNSAPSKINISIYFSTIKSVYIGKQTKAIKSVKEKKMKMSRNIIQSPYSKEWGHLTAAAVNKVQTHDTLRDGYYTLEHE